MINEALVARWNESLRVSAPDAKGSSAVAALARTLSPVLPGRGGAPNATIVTPLLLDWKALSEFGRDLERIKALCAALLESDPVASAPLSDNAAEPPASFQSLFLMARPDFLVVGGTPKLLEWNMHSNLGGMQMIGILGEAYLRSTFAKEFASEVAVWARHPFSDFARALGARSEALRAKGLVAEGFPDATFYLDLEETQAARRLPCALAAEGHPAAYGLPETLTYEGGRPFRNGVPLGYVLRRFISHHMVPEDVAALEPLERAARAGWCVVHAGRTAERFSDKGLLADLHALAEESDCGTAHRRILERDRRLVTKIVPWTRRVARGRMSKDRHQGDTERFLAPEMRHEFVLKRTNEGAGNGIIVGLETTAAAWYEAASTALAQGPLEWVLQEYQRPDEIELGVHGPGGLSFETFSLVMATYVFEDRLSGVLARVSAVDAGLVVNVARGAAVTCGLFTRGVDV